MNFRTNLLHKTHVPCPIHWIHRIYKVVVDVSIQSRFLSGVATTLVKEDTFWHNHPCLIYQQVTSSSSIVHTSAQCKFFIKFSPVL